MPPPHTKGGGGHIVFGTDPVGVGVGVSVDVGVELFVSSVFWILFGNFLWYLVDRT